MTETDIRKRKYVLKSLDFCVGSAIAIGLFTYGYFEPATIARPPLLITEAAIGGTVLAVSLTALAILVAFLGDEYIALLERSSTVKKAIVPYQVVAFFAAALVLSAIAGDAMWGTGNSWVRDVFGSLSTGLAAYAVIGTVQIVNITARHGNRRARIPAIRDKGRRAMKEKQKAV
jgi:hypothetical protein